MDAGCCGSAQLLRCQYLYIYTSQASKRSTALMREAVVARSRCQQVSALLQVLVLVAHSRCQQVSVLLQVPVLVARSSSGVSICTFVVKRVHGRSSAFHGRQAGILKKKMLSFLVQSTNTEMPACLRHQALRWRAEKLRVSICTFVLLKQIN
jgi:hypothetical protein